MSDATQNAIRAHVTTAKLDGYAKAKDKAGKKTYYYMFTGGYTYDAGKGTVGPHTKNPDEGPAGEVELTQPDSAFSVEVVDATNSGFKIKQWNLAKDGDLSGEMFSPQAGVDLDPLPTVLSVNVTQVPSGKKGKYKGYFVTLANDSGDVIELDPRIYDMRN